MGGLQVKIVTRAIEIGGHNADKPGLVLAVIRLAHLYTGDLCNGIGLIGGLQITGKKVFLFHRLGAVFRVDTGTT